MRLTASTPPLPRLWTPNPAWLEGVAYDRTTRRHRLDGRPVPSVTQVLDRLEPQRFAHVPPAVRTHSADIGTAVHAAALLQLAAPDAPAVQARVAAWQWFCQTRRVEPLLSEALVCSRDLGLPPARRRPYVGKLDVLCLVDRRLLVLLDLKTGAAGLARLQTLAYLDALYQQYPALLAVALERWAVLVDAAGRYRVHAFRDDALDAVAFRDALHGAYTAPDWRIDPMPDPPPPRLSLDLPDETSLFELPDVAGAPIFDLPDDEPDAAPAPDVLPPETPTIAELVIRPDLDTYLAQLEAAIAPYEATAQRFAADMAAAPIDTPEQLATLGQQALVAKARETILDELFEPAIRRPRQYLDRVYQMKRRVVQWVKTGGDTAARRYNNRKRELEETDRQARLEAARRAQSAEREAEALAMAERRRLTEQASHEAQAGHPGAAADLLEQARAVEAVPVPEEPPPVALAPAAAVAGISEREGWTGEIVDMKTALLASARPDILREVADMLAQGDLTPGGAATVTTTYIHAKLRAIALELPVIPSTMFAGNAPELKKRAAADRDTLHWPGFTFTQTHTPVRRPRRP